MIISTAAAALLVLGALAWAASVLRDPSFIFLVHEEQAQWIRHDRPFTSGLPALGTQRVAFRATFTVDDVPEPALMSFRALRLGHVELDGQLIYLDPGPLENWKRIRRLDLAPVLSPGQHSITFIAENENGPSLLLAYSDALGFWSGEDWESSLDRTNWAPAVSVDRVRPAAAGRAYKRSDLALMGLLPILLPLFLVVATWRYASLTGRQMPKWLSAQPSAGAIRWILISAMVLLGVNNILKIPPGYGFDVVGHMEYLQYLYERGRLPIATDGWKMFEAPLFYLVSLIPYSIIYDKLSPDSHIIAMRVLPLLCGVAQVELAYRSMRYVFPQRSDAQALGTVVASLIPLNLYLSQYVGNQPFVGLLSALTIYLSIRYLRTSDNPRPYRAAALIGLTLGLALLAKLTGILLVAPLAGLLFYAEFRRTSGEELSFWRLCVPALLAIAVATSVSGWYYLRNFIVLGSPFAVGYSEELGIVWRQDPGFRTISQFTHFGESLFYPVFAVFAGFWDSIYCTLWADGFISGGRYPDLLPPWNFDFMNAGALLGLVPSALIAAGLIAAILRPAQSLKEGSLFAVLWLGVHLAGMLYLFLTLPVVSAGKAAYLLNLLPCLGILAAGGFKMLQRSVPADPICCGALACWGVSVYAAFFVL